MNCGQRRDVIFEYVLGDLQAAERAELRAHLDTGCPECAASTLEAEKLELALNLSPNPIEPRPEMKQLLIGRLRSPAANGIDNPPLSQPVRRVPAWVVGGLSALAAGVVVFVALRPRATARWPESL